MTSTNSHSNKILTFGVFDYFHLGHLRLFEQCKQYGDYLIVAVQDEKYVKQFKPAAKLMYSTEERVEILEALRIVDEVIVYSTVSAETLRHISFDTLALGEDHKGGRFDAVEAWCHEHNRSVVRLKRTDKISSTLIKEKVNGDLIRK